MSSFRSFSLSVSLLVSVLSTATAGRAQTAAPATVNKLDAFVVSAGPDPKTAFDLAQGTSVLAGDELRRLAQATLGETLSATPGVSSTYYGPGASRPVIRGLGGDRVRVLDNGVGALDASNVSPDHNTALEPLFASRIEVLRGPSTLLYGSSAVGGAVNVIDNTIPDTPPNGSAHGTAEVRVGGAGRERAALVSAGGGARGFAVHLNALAQRTDDLAVPGVARSDADAPRNQPRGALPGSATETSSVAAGVSGFWSTGRAGAALTRYETRYGVPTGDDPATSIKMTQTRADLAGETTAAFGPFRGAKARIGLGDYTHAELSGGTTTNTTFFNKAAEGRLELPHVAIGALTGLVGAQAARSDFAAEGEEVVTPAALTESAAVFALEEFKASDALSLQFGARGEFQRIRLGELDAALPAVRGYAARSGQRRNSTGASASIGAVFYPVKDWSVALSLARTTRLPTAQELFSNGPHGGTAAYEIGTSGLGRERSLGVDLSVRRRTGFVTGALGVFANRFAGYIYQEELPAGAIPAANNPDGLTPYQFVARDARFRGAEAELLFHLLEEKGRRVHLELTADTVRAEQTATGEPLPRIPPRRYGGRLTYDDGTWRLGVEGRRTEAQARVAVGEATTDGYALLNADASYTLAARRVRWEFFLRGHNLANTVAREHASFLKAFAPLPGRSLGGGVRMTF
ncbi:MAG: hypothetical protein RLZZ15_3867 [Verrucomicrobiota bacterium]